MRVSGIWRAQGPPLQEIFPGGRKAFPHGGIFAGGHKARPYGSAFVGPDS